MHRVWGKLGRGRRDCIKMQGSGPFCQEPASTQALSLAHRRVLEGATYVEVAAELSCSLRFLYRLFGKQKDRPVATSRSPLRLSVAEREEISRGIHEGVSLRIIASRLQRATSTIAREVSANGGRASYRAWRADERALRLARRPRDPKLARSPIEALLDEGANPSVPTGRDGARMDLARMNDLLYDAETGRARSPVFWRLNDSQFD
jgi:hypothetical protein